MHGAGQKKKFWSEGPVFSQFLRFLHLVVHFLKKIFSVLAFAKPFACAFLCYLGDFLVRSIVPGDTSCQAVKVF